MSTQRIPVISVKGNAYECGFQYGSQAKALIKKNVDAYFDMWRILWKAERARILDEAKGFISAIGNYDAGILEELEGIARGAELSLEEIIAINARYEINFSLGIAPEYKCGGCTSAAALPEVTRDGHTIMGQNWDWLPRFKEFNVLLEVEQKGKPGLVTQPEAGVLSHRGMNSVGLGVCYNGLSSSLDKFSPGVPFLVILRAVLYADNYARSLKAVLGTKASISGNFFIAHRDGEAIDLEVSPAEVGCVYPEDGILTHSNHFLALLNRKDMADILKSLYPDTLFRYQRARQILEKDRGKIDVASFKRVFSDHFSHPTSICRHPDPALTGIKGWITLYSIIMDLSAGSLYVAEGPPCQTDYYQHTPKCLHQS